MQQMSFAGKLEDILETIVSVNFVITSMNAVVMKIRIDTVGSIFFIV